MAPTVAVVLIGWCIAQVFFDALLASEVAVLPDQVPVANAVRSRASSASACRSPRWARPSWSAFTGDRLTMFLAPCAIGGFFILLFALVLNDRRLDTANKPPWSLREFVSVFYVNPRK